jgi:hypothetical protein
MFATLSLSLNAGIFGDNNPLTGKGSTAPISALGADTDINSIIEAITSITGSLDEYFSKYNLDSLTNQIGGDSKLFQCMTKGLDLGSILPDTSFDGLCQSFSLADAGLDLGDVGECLGIKMPDLKNSSLGAFCDKSGTATGGKIDDNLIIGGAINKPTTENPKGVTYSAPVERLVGSIIADGIPNNTDKKSLKDIEDRKFPSGKTGKWMYKEGGGVLEREAKKYPSGSTAKALKEFDTPALVLKEIAAATLGTTNINDIKLPQTKADAIKASDLVVKIDSYNRLNLEKLSDYIAKEVQEKFKTIEASTLEEYYKKEKEVFLEYVSTNKQLKLLYKYDADTIKNRVADLLLLESTKKTYINDPSQTRADSIVKEQRAKFKYLALIQNVRNTRIKVDAAIEIKDRKQAIDKAVRDAYSKASLWRGDIAKKEIDTMLSAVDQIIK